ncbi:MAG: serine/threonine protein kinase [Myxococcales bacterium]|nr:serine/threonine protein kinase [Myxococcales bacterium]
MGARRRPARPERDRLRLVGARERRPSRRRPRARPSSRLGHYLILRKLGAGGWGSSSPPTTRSSIAGSRLKLVHRSHGESSGGQARILREAQALARLSHPNVVQIYEVGEHQGQVFLAMEFVDGEPLSSWQAAAGRSLGAIVDAYRQAAEGLRAAHAAGLVHRDFKPDNALVGVDGRVRVLDFGLARSRHGSPASDAAEGSGAGEGVAGEGGAGALRELDLSAPGSIAGTPAYMSPEQFKGEGVDLRSDLFSFSVALWEAIYGRRPFAGRSVVELAAAVCAVERPSPPARVDVPERLRRALARGLALRPDERWASLDPLVDVLSIDPAADPSAARGAHRLFLGIFAAGMLAGPVFFGLVFRGSFEVRKTIFFGSAIFGALMIFATAFAFRRTLLRNAYHRRMLLFLGVVAVVAGSQRVIATARGLPLDVIVVDALHITAACFFVGAVFFARWMVAPGLLAVVGIVAALALPSLFPGALLVVAPSIMISFGFFWNREASRGPRG